MRKTLGNEVAYLFPGWLFCVLLPLPAIVLRHSDDGVPCRFGCFFIGCASLVAFAFKRDVNPAMLYEKGSEPTPTWSNRLVSVSIALLLAFATFFIFTLALNSLDFVAGLKALFISMMSFCIVPYLTLIHRKPFVAVVFTLALVLCIKLLWLNTSVLQVSFYYAGKRKFHAIYNHSKSCRLAQS